MVAVYRQTGGTAVHHGLRLLTGRHARPVDAFVADDGAGAARAAPALRRGAHDADAPVAGRRPALDEPLAFELRPMRKLGCSSSPGGTGGATASSGHPARRLGRTQDWPAAADLARRLAA